MKEKVSPLFSRYVIDGVQQELTPAQILASVSLPGAEVRKPEDISGVIVDETPEPAGLDVEWDEGMVDKYLTSVLRVVRKVPMATADSYTRARIETSLIGTLWRLGHFRLGDLCLGARWQWNDSALGSMAGFYSSVQAAGDFLDALGISLDEYSYESCEGRCGVDFTPDIRPGAEPDELVEPPFGSGSPRMGAASLPSTIQPDPSSWLVYIPFDSSAYRMGGSLLAQALKIKPPVTPQVNDPDYFIDCYEVLRELSEDGIVLAAASVGDGGLIAALKGMTSQRTGVEIDLTDLRKATGEDSTVRLLFAEVPGAVIQIRAIDFDYSDAELLLQDVAFYPLGHPVSGGGVRIRSSVKTGIQNILDALIQKQGGEGED